MKNLIICCAFLLSLTLTSSVNAHDGLVRRVVRNTVCVTTNVALTPVRIVRNVQPVRTVLHNAGHPVRRVVNLSLLPVRFVFGR